MAIKALNVGSAYVFSSPDDPDIGTPEATVYHLQTLDARVMGNLKDKVTKIMMNPGAPDDVAPTTVAFEEMNFEMVQFAMTSWDNQLTSDGQQLEIKHVKRRLGGQTYSLVDPEVLAMIPLSVIRQIADRVRDENELGEEDVKN